MRQRSLGLQRVSGALARLSLLAIESPHPLTERMPAKDQRNSEAIHLKIAGITVVYRRHVSKRKCIFSVTWYPHV